jgi:hypothetical protein
MRRICMILWLITWAGILSWIDVEAMEHGLQGQASGWHTEARDQGDRYYHLGIRYIPQLSLAQTLNGDCFLDLEASLNAFASASSSDQGDDHDMALYRLKARFATAQTETRIGLQKLNFGPAFLLRPLRWFDNLDPRDPLGLTDGVYALRFRYTTLNNTSLWLWGLYGNNDAKGFELLLTVEDKPEFGGRLQYPLLDGELAFTVHLRKVQNAIEGMQNFTENRFALDGRWDVEVGLWFESVLQQQRSDDLPFQWMKMVTLGIDYTLSLGNGLHILGEHLASVSSEDPLGWDQDAQVSAFSLNYPLGYSDNLSAIGSYSWDDEEYYQYLAWQRTWDNWILNLSVFHYPESNHSIEYHQREAPAAGYGAQMLIIFNH